MQSLQFAAGVLEPAAGAAAGLGRWLGGVVVWPLSGVFQLRKCRFTTTLHRTLPVYEWPALGMPLATARSNAASEVFSRYGGACTWCCGWARQVVYGGERF